MGNRVQGMQSVVMQWLGIETINYLFEKYKKVTNEQDKQTRTHRYRHQFSDFQRERD